MQQFDQFMAQGEIWIDIAAGAGQADGDIGDHRGIRRGGHHQDAVGEQAGLIHIVGDRDHGLAVNLPQFQELEFSTGERIECAEGFIQEQDLRFDCEGAGDAHALLYTAGQPCGAAVGCRGQANHLQVAVGDLVALRLLTVTAPVDG